MLDKPKPRELIWLGGSLERLAAFPPPVRRKLGFALYPAQIGQRHESAKMLRGFSETVWQVRADDPSGTYRSAYVTQLREAIYVLQSFRRRRPLESRFHSESWIRSGSGFRLRAH